MKFLFIATLGPVQPFIASARRTHDLYAGSTLLSELSKAAAKALFDNRRATLIFPAPGNNLQSGSSFNVANKIVALVDAEETFIHQLGKEVYTVIQERLNQIKAKVFQDVELFNAIAADEQIQHLVEYAWVATPFNDAVDGAYADAREKAEALLSARKNTQFFSPVTWGSSQEKSSIDGRLESVIPPRMSHPGNPEPERDDIVRLYRMYKAGPHERLSAVDLLKRLAKFNEEWFDDKQRPHSTPPPRELSTSHVAALPFLERLRVMGENSKQDQNLAKERWERYMQQVRKLAPSPDLLFEEIPHKLAQPHPVTGYADGALLFVERLWDDLDGVDQQAIFADAKVALEAFFAFTDTRLNGLRPSPYYAILLADGDRMGEVIDDQARKGYKQHSRLSEALARFAGMVRGIVDQHRGSLVYAGGDDVLALLPLDTVLSCSRELAETFQKTLQPYKHNEHYSPTLSVGIAVVHHVDLLQDALAFARQAEQKAKEQTGKNALAILIQKRSGEPHGMVVSWHIEHARQEEHAEPFPSSEAASDYGLHTVAQFEQFVELARNGIIPEGMAYELRTMLQRLQTSRDDAQFEHVQHIVQIDAARILRRKLYFSQDRAKQETLKALVEKMALPSHLDLASSAGDSPPKPQDIIVKMFLHAIGVKRDDAGAFAVVVPLDITSFIDALIVAQMLAEALTPTATKGGT